MSDEVVVQLTAAEMMSAGVAGLSRRIGSILNKRDTKGHDKKKPWENDVVGAMAEYAVTVHLNLSWSGLIFGAADVGGIIEVRVVYRPSDRLTIRNEDKPKKDRPFVSVYAIDNLFTLRGWMFGYEAMTGAQTDPSGEGREPAWYVENSALHSMKSLRDWVNANRPILK